MTKRTVRKRKKSGLPRYTVRGCPYTKNNSQWCYGFCEPVDGKGACEREAPHAIEGRIQKGIREHKEKKKKAQS